MKLSHHGSTLLNNLRHLFAGNHAVESDVQANAEETEQYAASVAVQWQFAHDVQTTTSKGNSAVRDAHFAYDAAAFNRHISTLCERAVRDREIRGPFMTRMSAMGADGLDASNIAQPVFDYGAASVHRQCTNCSGRGKVRCGSCGGSGSHMRSRTHTRWNGKQNETHTEWVNETCSGCGGSGRVRCGACAGHGFFTDVSRVQSIARPRWSVPFYKGLAGEALTRVLQREGPRGARQLVPFTLVETEYNDDDHWVAHYAGIADVVQLDLTVVSQPYTVAAVGSHVVPILTPPVFDQLLRAELEMIRALMFGKRGKSQVRRRAKILFDAFCKLPVLDKAMQYVAKLDRSTQPSPRFAVARAAEQFLSEPAADAIGQAFQHVLDKVSPAYSRAAWGLVALLVGLLGFYLCADRFSAFSIAHPWYALVPLVWYAALVAALMVIVSPVGWLLSASVSAAKRRKVPTEYRQRGRNWAPLKAACVFTSATAVIGSVYGAAGTLGVVPPAREVVSPAVRYGLAHTPEGSEVHLLLAELAPQVTPLQPRLMVSDTDARRDVQLQLEARGYPMAADGTWGPATLRAVHAFEHRNGLPTNTTPLSLLAYLKAHPTSRRVAGE